MVAEACNINFQKILENVVNLDEVGLEGLEKLAKAGVDDKDLANILVKYADDPVSTNTVFTVFGTDPTTSAKLLNKFKDNTVEFVGRYGDDGYQALSRYEDEAISILNKYKDDIVEQTTISRFLKNVKGVDFTRLVDKISLDQAYETSRLAQGAETGGVKFRLYITGRLADTVEEAAKRGEAAALADDLVIKFKNNEEIVPSLTKLVNDARINPEKYDLDVTEDIEQQIEKWLIKPWAQNKAANQFSPMSWPQAKISTGASEVDFFIHKRTWDNELGPWQQEVIDTIRKKIFKVNKSDAYQTIRSEGWERALWKEGLLDRRYPSIHPPPGSVMFGSDGTIVHNFLGGTQ